MPGRTVSLCPTGNPIITKLYICTKLNDNLSGDGTQMTQIKQILVSLKTSYDFYINV